MRRLAELREAKRDSEAFRGPQRWKAMTAPNPAGVRLESDTHQNPVIAEAVGNGLPNSSGQT